MKPWRKVFSVVPDCHVSGGHYRVLWQRHFYDGLRQAVESLVTPREINFNWARQRDANSASQAVQRAETSNQLWEQISQAHHFQGLDVVVSYCFGHDLEPELIRRVIQLGIPWINFFCDSTHAFEKVATLARVTSLNWFPESAATASYRALGVPSVCLPYALNPDCLLPGDCRAPQRETVFIGVPTTNRITQLGLLRLRGCRVDIRGHGWIGSGDDPFHSSVPRSRRLLKSLFQPGLFEKGLRRAVWPLVKQQAGGPLGDDELVPYLQGSQVVLGLNQGKDSRGRFSSYLKFRDLEFPGYGCCYLTEFNEDVATALEVGREVLAYRDLGEAAAWIRQIRKTPEKFHGIGMAGRRRVLSSHVWSGRLRELAGAL